MRGLTLLFLASPLIASAVTIPTPIVREATQLLKVPISSKLIAAADALPLQLLTKSRPRSNAPLGNAVLKVVASVQCGNDQTFNDVLVDTGSAILWVGGEKPYIPGPNTMAMNTTFGVGYGIGGTEGTAYYDTVIIGEATAARQIVGAANSTSGFKLVRPIDGILGLGPSNSNVGDVKGLKATPTFVETLVAQKQISKPIFGIFINPLGTDGTPEGTGEITFGGIDESKIQGQMTWLPQNPPVDYHWEFNVSSFSFGCVNLTQPTVARTDSGVLGIGVPFDSFFAMRDKYNGTFNSGNSALNSYISFNTSITPSLPNLDITLGSETFSIPPSRYIVPLELYPSLNLTDNGLTRTWIVSAGPGEFNLGQKALESIYTAYDMENHLVGFAHSHP